MKLKFGSLNIKLKGDDKYVSPFLKEFEAEMPYSTNNVDLILDLGDGLPVINDITHHLGKGFGGFGENVIFMNNNPYFSYAVVNPFCEGPVELRVWFKKTSFVYSALALLRCLFSVEFSSTHKLLKNSIASYSVFYWVLSLALLKRGDAFLHAAGVGNSKNSLLIAGSGGCGKTSTTFQLLENEENEFLFEDFGIVSNNSKALYSPKPISLYYSDYRHGSVVSGKAVAALDRKRALRWRILTGWLGRNPIIKVPPVDLVGSERLGGDKDIAVAVFMVRKEIKAIKVSSVSVDEFCKRSALASLRELKSLTEILAMIRANLTGDCTLLDGVDVESKMLAIYNAAFEKVPCYIFEVPKLANPADIERSLMEVWHA